MSFTVSQEILLACHKGVRTEFFDNLKPTPEVANNSNQKKLTTLPSVKADSRVYYSYKNRKSWPSFQFLFLFIQPSITTVNNNS